MRLAGIRKKTRHTTGKNRRKAIELNSMTPVSLCRCQQKYSRLVAFIDKLIR